MQKSGALSWADISGCSICDAEVWSTARFCSFCGSNLQVVPTFVDPSAFSEKLAEHLEAKRLIALSQQCPDFWGAVLDTIWTVNIDWAEGVITLKFYSVMHVTSLRRAPLDFTDRAIFAAADAVCAPAIYNVNLPGSALGQPPKLVEAPLATPDALYFVHPHGVLWWPSRSEEHNDFDFDRVSKPSEQTEQADLLSWSLPDGLAASGDASTEAAYIVSACVLADLRLALLVRLNSGALVVRAGFGGSYSSPQAFPVIAVLEVKIARNAICEILPSQFPNGGAGASIFTSQGNWSVSLEQNAHPIEICTDASLSPGQEDDFDGSANLYLSKIQRVNSVCSNKIGLRTKFDSSPLNDHRGVTLAKLASLVRNGQKSASLGALHGASIDWIERGLQTSNSGIGLAFESTRLQHLSASFENGDLKLSNSSATSRSDVESGGALVPLRLGSATLVAAKSGSSLFVRVFSDNGLPVATPENKPLKIDLRSSTVSFNLRRWAISSGRGWAACGIVGKEGFGVVFVRANIKN